MFTENRGKDTGRERGRVRKRGEARQRLLRDIAHAFIISFCWNFFFSFWGRAVNVAIPYFGLFLIYEIWLTIIR